MFTDKELKDLHYKMWDYIADKIVEYKTIINIEEVKLEFLESENIDFNSIKHACPMCQYASQHLPLNYYHMCRCCPSALNVDLFRGCLSGLFGLCGLANDYRTQLILVLAIRDSWKE